MMLTGKAFAKLFVIIIFIFVFVTGSLADLDFKTIDTLTLHSMVVNNAYELEGGRPRHFVIIDARTKKEYDEAHVFSSISMPVNDFEKSLNLLPHDKGVLLIVYCNDTRSDVSQKWAQKAAAAGYSHIVIYKEGFLIWKKNEMPIAPINGI